MRVLVTGVAGFIGFHLARKLLAEGVEITGLDNCNDYYDPSLKEARLELLREQKPDLDFSRLDLADQASLCEVFERFKPTHVVNLAGQAGVRYSLVNPASYLSANLTGFGNLLECCRQHEIRHLIYASSSSVYGLNGLRPCSVRHNVDHPISLYAATKKSNELMAHAYSHLFGLPTTGLRFFTVYGPWGRPDMALDIFTRAILRGEPIRVFNYGRSQRDFTYVDDIVECMSRLLRIPATPDETFDPAAPNPGTSSAPWRLYNIGNNETIELEEFISTLEEVLGKKAIREYLPMQPGDVQATWADIGDLTRVAHFTPHTPLREGMQKFVAWYRDYYGE